MSKNGFKEEISIFLFKQIIEGINYLHNKNLYHREKSVINGLNYLFKYYEKNNYYEFIKLIIKNWIKGCYNHIKSLNKSYNKYIYSI